MNKLINEGMDNRRRNIWASSYEDEGFHPNQQLKVQALLDIFL